MNKKTEIKRRQFPFIFWFSILTNTAIIGISIFRNLLMNKLTVFLVPIIEIFIIVLFLISLTWSLIFYIRERKKGKKLIFLTLLINIITGLIVLLVPFAELSFKLDFYLNFDKREEVVERVINGELKPEENSDGGLIQLPEEYYHLSKTGLINFEKKDKNLNILFFTFRGITDNFAGFIYKSNKHEPQQYDFGCEFLELKKLKEHWFWAACT